MKKDKDDVDRNLVAEYRDKYTVNYPKCCTEINNTVFGGTYTENETFLKNDLFKKISEFKLNHKHLFIMCIICLFISIHNFITHSSFIPFLAASIIMAAYGYHLLVAKDIERQNELLDDARQNMQELTNPNRMYERLGVDILSLHVGNNLLEIVDPDQDMTLLGKVAGLRQRLTDTLGYIIPSVRILDSVDLEKNEYAIKVRGNLAATGNVYPGKYMVKTSQWEDLGYFVPKNAIEDYSPLDGEKVYWLNEKNIQNKNISYMAAEDVIIEHLRDCCIKCINKIMEKTDVLKIMEMVKAQDPTLINDLVPLFISAIDLKTIFCNLISKGIPIKDIIYIFEILNDYARYTQNVNRLTNILITELTGLKV